MLAAVCFGLMRSAVAAPLAKAEPAKGCYFSVFVGPDLSVREAMVRGGTLEDAVARIIHKEIAVEWLYFFYDDPGEVAAYLHTFRKRPAVLEIALEPRNGLNEVRDDAALHNYARMMAAFKRPIFLRFASEMNGSWTPYHSDPALYRKTFRMVHDVMARLAPNVVMVWCVSNEPHQNIDAYYPGDDAVDWVGVNFYSVLHHNNDPGKPADQESPLAMLDYVYRKYARRKPIAICEYGASHQEKLRLDADRSDWAATKLTELLTALPQRYPRVKLVGLFNVNTMQQGFQSAGGRANNFCFTDSPAVSQALQRALATDYYLSRVPEESAN